MTKKKTAKKAPAKAEQEQAADSPRVEQREDVTAENFRDVMADIRDEVTDIETEIAGLHDQRKQLLNRHDAIAAKFGPRYNTPAERIAEHQRAVKQEQERKLAVAERGGVARSKLDQVLSASNKANQKKVPPRLAGADNGEA